MQFAGKVADRPADILVDSGFGDFFISEAFARKLEIKIEHALAAQVTLPGWAGQMSSFTSAWSLAMQHLRLITLT